MANDNEKTDRDGQASGETEGQPSSENAGNESVENEKILEAAASAAAGETEPEIDTLDDLKKQLDAQSDRYLRLMAEFDNFKKRVSRDYERLVESANERLIIDLLDVRENFERALKTGDQAADAKAVFDGMKLIYSKFDAVLAKNGLEPFGAAGDVFDPQVHDALMKTPNETVAEDHIVEVFEKGYSLKKRVIKHAKVIVSGGKPEKA